MSPGPPHPVVHLELHTHNLPRACAFYSALFGWRAELVHLGAESYLALGVGDRVDGGVVERDADESLWLPYVQVRDIDAATERARRLGADVVLDPREGHTGWRSVIAAPAGARIALWQRKE